jgi:hypothetical protein
VAGLSGKQDIVDVAALAGRLRPDEAPTEDLPAEPPTQDLPEVAAEPGPTCALGHENVPGARFCASCGLDMTAPAPAMARAEGVRPRPAGELTAEELAERERRHAAALAETARFEAAQPDYQPTEGAAVLIHFIEDGLTAFGQVWYRGQELEIGPEHPRWEEARGWITLTRYQQVDRWGRQFFEHGPWPGRRSYTEEQGSFERLTGTDHQGNAVTIQGPGEEALRAADAAEARRNRGVPAPVFR